MFKNNKKIAFIGLLVVIAVYSLNSSKWRGYAYPDKNNLSNSIYLGEFKSEDECNAAAIFAILGILTFIGIDELL